MLQPLAAVLAQSLRQAGLGHVVLEGQLQRHWKDIVGLPIAAVTQPERVRGQVLFVAVADAVWLQQLTFYQARIMQNIRRTLGDVPLTRVRFVLTSSSASTATQTTAYAERRSLSAAEEQQIISHTADITDSDLRQAIQQTWRRAWQARR